MSMEHPQTNLTLALVMKQARYTAAEFKMLITKPLVYLVLTDFNLHVCMVW